MSFKRTTEHLYWWPVTVAMPDPDPKKAGKIYKSQLKLQFLALPLEEGEAFNAEFNALPASEKPNYEKALLKRVVKDWDDVIDDSNQKIPFSETELDVMLSSTFFRLAAFRAYGESLAADGGRKGN